MPRHLMRHRPPGRHGITWPGDDHATFAGMGRNAPLTLRITHTYSPSKTNLPVECTRLNFARMTVPPAEQAAEVPTVMLPP